MKAWGQQTDEIYHEPLWDAELRLSMGSPGIFPHISAYYLNNPFMKSKKQAWGKCVHRWHAPWKGKEQL